MQDRTLSRNTSPGNTPFVLSCPSPDYFVDVIPDESGEKVNSRSMKISAGDHSFSTIPWPQLTCWAAI